MNPITVLLAEDHDIVREGLRSLLEISKDFLVLGEAKTGLQAVDLAVRLRPEVVVMDIGMPIMNGFQATYEILQARPKTRILVLSAHSDDEYVARMTSVGVLGYLTKQNSGQSLVHAIKEVAAGRPFFSPSIQRRLSDAKRRAMESGLGSKASSVVLTTREEEVLHCVAEGKSNKQVAERLGISIKTVEKHRQQLMDKLNIHDTAGLTRHAIAKGIIDTIIPVDPFSPRHQNLPVRMSTIRTSSTRPRPPLGK